MSNILFVNLPFTGHTNPSFPLVKELIKRGHRITYINSAKWKDKIESLGAVFIPYQNYPDTLTQLQKLRSCFQAAYTAAAPIAAEYDLLIYDQFFYPGKFLAERNGLPCVCEISQPVWNKDIISYYQAREKNRMLIVWALSLLLLDSFVIPRKVRKAIKMKGKHLIDSCMKDVPELNIVLLSERFQPCRETLKDNYLFAAPRYEYISNNTIPFTEMKKPIIYISLGSIIRSRRFYKKCIEAFGYKDLTVIISIGNVNPSTLGTIPDNIFIYPYVPQLEVLQHSDLFITHGGMNSINEAIYYGVPMLVMPISLDQPMNAMQVERLVIGKRLKTTHKPSQIYQSAMDLLKDEKMKENINDLKQEIQSNDQIVDAVDQIEGYLNKINSKT